MIWVQRDASWISGFYRVCRDQRGYSVWYYGDRPARLGLEVAGLKTAQLVAECHAKRQNVSTQGNRNA